MSPFSFGEDPLNNGETANIMCTVLKGDLPLDIHWTLNSAPIVTGEEGFTIMKMNPRTSYLNIDSAEAKHRGIYKCIAINLAGLAENAAELRVNGLFTYK